MRIFQPLRSLRFAMLLSGLSLSAIGDQLYALALSWIAVGAFGPYAGYLTGLQALVGLTALVGIGRWADRWDRYRSMIVADLCRAAVLVAVVGFWLLSGSPNASHLIGAIVVLAIGEAVFRPALQTVLPSLIDDHQLLPAANGLLDATSRTARLLGPGLIAVLAGIVPVVHFLTIDAFSFIASAAAMFGVTRLTRVRAADHSLSGDTFWASAVRGIRAMRSHRLLSYVLMVVGPINGAWYVAYYLALPLIIKQHGNSGPTGSGLGAFGLVLSAYGCTNLATTLVLGSRRPTSRPQIRICVGILFIASGMLLLVLASLLPAPWLIPGLMFAAAVGAIGGPLMDIEVAVLRQTRLQRSDMAAAMRVYMAANMLGLLAAMLLAPPLILVINAAGLILVCAALVAAIGITGLVRYATWFEPDRVLQA